MQQKIGILTFHNGPNYGGFMQAWHMRNKVRELGHPCTVINYLNRVHTDSNKVCSKVRNLGDLKARIHWMIKERPFRSPIRELSDAPFTTEASAVPWNSFGGVVVGSDVVFDFQNPKFGSDPAYFGACPEQRDVPIMSYAASCGMADVSGDLPEFCNGLQRFSALGVRDAASKTLVKRVTGEDATLNVDPTWLAADPVDESWNRPQGKYLLIYGRRLNPEWAKHLVSYCKKRNLRIVSAGNPDPFADEVRRNLTPFQWVDLFRRAEATVIGTLHGTLYSIKYNKPFILINNQATRQKVKEAVDLTGMGFRRFELQDLKPNLVELLDSSGGALPEIPPAWKKESVSFFGVGIKQMLDSTR